MKIEEFCNEIERIKNYYQKDKEIDDYVIQVYYDKLKHLSIERFRLIESKVYETCKFFPKLPEILEINDNLGYIAKPVDDSFNCSNCIFYNHPEYKCDRNNQIIYKKTVMGIEYDFTAQSKNCGKNIFYVDKNNKYLKPYIEDIKIVT
jgi:hypothetical protein